MVIKTKDLFFFIVLSIIILVFLFLILYAFCKIYHSDIDYCLDSSICKQGLEINTEYGLVKINKESCLKYNWTWIEEQDSCKLK